MLRAEFKIAPLAYRALSNSAGAERYMHAKPVRPWSTHRLTQKIAPEPGRALDYNGESAAAFRERHEQHEKLTVTNKPLSDTNAPTKRRRPLKPLKAAITLSPSAVEHLRKLLDSPQPKFIRIGVRNRGCSGLTYNLEYVEKPGKFDEEVSQDGVKVLIDSKALFSVIGSRMDWVDDKLSSRFVFANPNSKGQCGCGESFMV